MVKMTRCLRDDPGSIPGEGANFRPCNSARPQPTTDMKLTKKQLTALTVKVGRAADKAHKAYLAMQDAAETHARSSKRVRSTKAKLQEADKAYAQLNKLWWKHSCDA